MMSNVVIANVEESSAIAHLAMTAYPNRLWGKTILGMFTACFDASGSEDDRRKPYLGVAGYISTAERWNAFTELWDKRITQEGLKYFRMSEFAQSTREFAAWKTDEDRRRRLLNDLLDLVKDHVIHMFGCVVKISALQDMTVEMRQKFHLSAYVLAGRNCAGEVAKWIHEQANGEKPAPCVLVYEEGDTGQSSLEKRLREDEFPYSFEPKLEKITKSGLVKRGFIPLQAADILAYEVTLGAQRGNFNRYPAAQLNSIPGRIAIFEEEDMPELESRLRALDR